MLKRFLKNNMVVAIYTFLALTMEITSQIFFDAKPYFTKFWVTLLLLLMVVTFLFSLRNPRQKLFFAMNFLIIQSAIQLGCNFLYLSNGTTFQKEMVSQRNDAFGTLETIVLSWGLVAVCIVALASYLIILCLHHNKYIKGLLETPDSNEQGLLETSDSNEQGLQDADAAAQNQNEISEINENETVVTINNLTREEKRLSAKRHKAMLKARKKANTQAEKAAETKTSKRVRIACLAMSLICTATFCIMPLWQGVAEKKREDYYYKLTSSQDGNQMYGATANFLMELIELGSSSGISLKDIDEVDSFLTDGGNIVTSNFNGISEGNNLLVILVESFDTHILEEQYTGYDKDETALLFPNIMRIMDEGITATNFRQKEKTDTSECMSLLGSYPTKNYVNNHYYNNSYPFALPSLFKQKAEQLAQEDAEWQDAQVVSFHQNQGDFYNRNVLHESFGFDEFVDINDMQEYGVENTWNKGTFSKGERTLDSETARLMKDVMIPADKPFFTYWTTFVMHGFYETRETLRDEGYYDELEHWGMFPTGSKFQNYLRTYAATVMDFDRSLGIILDDLEQKKVLDKTTIVILSDHNTYYNNLTVEAKGIKNKLDTEAFRIPFMIYDQKLSKAFDDANGATDEYGRRVVEKFTTTADLVPTLCDLFGINAWRNMYLGSTIFQNEQESIVYSRVYSYFFNDKVAFFNINDIRWTSDDYVPEDLVAFEERARIHLNKLYYLDKIYYSNYFDPDNNEYKIPSNTNEPAA